MVEAVNAQRADSLKSANAATRAAADAGNDVSWKGAQLTRQDAQLAESRRHNRANEGNAAARLAWDKARAQLAGNATGPSGSALGKLNYDPAKLRQWFTREEPDPMMEGKFRNAVDYEGMNAFNDWMVNNPHVRDMNEGFLLWQRQLKQPAQQPAPNGPSFDAATFVPAMLERGADVVDVQQHLEQLRQQGLPISDAQARQALSLAHRLRQGGRP